MVPLTFTVTPIRGSPFSSTTIPVTAPFCANAVIAARQRKNIDRMGLINIWLIRENLIQLKDIITYAQVI